MKEDVLEQIVDDYLQMQGYFTTHNVRFNPPKDQDYVTRDESVSSDIDVVGLHPLRTGADRVMVVSYKSWQSGFDAARILAQLRPTTPSTQSPRQSTPTRRAGLSPAGSGSSDPDSESEMSYSITRSATFSITSARYSRARSQRSCGR